MPLIACPECTQSVSSLAQACPHCGYPVSAQSRTAEEDLVRCYPSFFKGNGFMHIPAVLLSFLLVGLIIYLLEWIRVRSTQLVVTTHRTILVDGLFEKNTSEVHHDDVRNLQVKQTFAQRIFNTGDLELSSAAQGGIEIIAKGFPDPDEISKLIWSQREGNQTSSTD